MSRINGKAVLIKVDDKYYGGVTDIDYSVSPVFVESLIKEDDGDTQKEIESIERKISLSGIALLNDGASTTHTDMVGIRTAVESGELIPFVYGMFSNGMPEITGKLQLTSYSEKSAASGKMTWSAEAEIKDDESFTMNTTTE